MSLWSGERLETNIVGRIAIEHLHRYALALNYVKNKIVLDIACGEGYGSFLISNKSKQVYGVDINEETIQFASQKYKNNNLTFLKGSTSKIPLEDNTVEVIISFETIEHHDEHDQMMLEIKRVLKPDGIVIMSSPDKLYYSDKRNYKNIFHVKELYKNEFKILVEKYFNEVQMLSQTHINGVSLILDEEKQSSLEIYGGNFKRLKSEDKKPMFLVAILSDQLMEINPISVFNGYEVDNDNLKYQERKIKSTLTFKLGKFVLSPLVILKKIFKN
ncbi:MAG: hypothetical protein CO117_00435 [Flavobacteriaceae bacterium CG_4_9_14_3_um_filter_33_16]|nr:MAG: hypothetical protein CO117_00435 [Flavobacteriaceae bacterium CG_4_9_14_3_um_filter_33_16]